jgi:hypothetical protein
LKHPGEVRNRSDQRESKGEKRETKDERTAGVPTVLLAVGPVEVYSGDCIRILLQSTRKTTSLQPDVCASKTCEDQSQLSTSVGRRQRDSDDLLPAEPGQTVSSGRPAHRPERRGTSPWGREVRMSPARESNLRSFAYGFNAPLHSPTWSQRSHQQASTFQLQVQSCDSR